MKLALTIPIAGRKARTIEDTTVSRRHPSTEGSNFVFLESVVRTDEYKARSWKVANQIALCWLVSLFNPILVSHDSDIGVPARL